jgi:uncharacterized protein (UPF0264 family)
MAGLIVSVRTKEEADAALEGGATLLDVKEPRIGALGRPPIETIESIVARVAGRVPVSAAMGELLETPALPPRHGLEYVKWGLSGYGRKDWRGAMIATREELERCRFTCRPVAVAYADWKPACAPPPDSICDFACDCRFDVLLLDTWEKNGTTLLDWMSVAQLSVVAKQCRSSRIRLALAGSLGPNEIAQLSALEPDWFAVRGAVCQDGERGNTIDTNAVRRIAIAASRGPISAPA